MFSEDQVLYVSTGSKSYVPERFVERGPSVAQTESRQQSNYSTFSIQCTHICLHGLCSILKGFVLPHPLHFTQLSAAGGLEAFFSPQELGIQICLVKQKSGKTGLQIAVVSFSSPSRWSSNEG